MLSYTANNDYKVKIYVQIDTRKIAYILNKTYASLRTAIIIYNYNTILLKIYIKTYMLSLIVMFIKEYFCVTPGMRIVRAYPSKTKTTNEAFAGPGVILMLVNLSRLSNVSLWYVGTSASDIQLSNAFRIFRTSLFVSLK